MDQQQYEDILKISRNPSPPVAFQLRSTDFSQDASDRTLLWGYTTDRESFHVYLMDGIVHRVVYQGGDEPVATTEIEKLEDLIPNKRLYPEACDFEFCTWLADKRIRLPFTTFDPDRVSKTFYGKVAGQAGPNPGRF